MEKDKHVLGASTSIRFATKSGAYDDQLLNIVNLSIEVSRAPFNLDNVREYFLQFWNEHTNTYDIDDRMLRKYLDERLEPVRQILTIPEALGKHYGVLLRSVNRTVEENSQVLKFGRDYLILAYNPVLQQYIALSPEGTLISLDALKIENGNANNIVYIYYNDNHYV